MTPDSGYTPPEVTKDAFNCPYCEAYASQSWSRLKVETDGKFGQAFSGISSARQAKCRNCEEYHIWVNERMVYPKSSAAPLPADEMPDSVERDYREARQVVSDSPKAAAALLRRAIEGLVDHLLDDPDDHLYTDIKNLADEDIIDDRIRKAFDAIRVSGNDYTHAGRIYADDNREKALQLFELTNTIVRTTIADDRLIADMYEEIPENKKREDS